MQAVFYHLPWMGLKTGEECRKTNHFKCLVTREGFRKINKKDQL